MFAPERINVPVPVLTSDTVVAESFSLMTPLSVTKPVPFPVRVSVVLAFVSVLSKEFWMVKAPELICTIWLPLMLRPLPAMMSVTLAVLFSDIVPNVNKPAMLLVEV